ncbi:MAG: polysaccharide biosynthesis tyrosine autokinase [Candidatus Aminicenantales bacterium]
MMAEHNIETKKRPIAQVQQYWRDILKWKWTGLIFFFTVVTGATLYSLLTTPIYTASGSVWIEDVPKILPFEEIQALDAGTNLPSHARLLQSRALAAKIIEKLKLYENPEFVGKVAKGKGSIDASDPIFREGLIESFLRSIAVAPVVGTRLVDVKFSNRNPRLAAEILNALFDGFIDMIVRKRYMTSEQATEFLNTQVATLRTEIEELEKKFNEYGSEKDILPLTAAEAPAVTRLSEVNRALTNATIDRINKLNYYNQLKSAPLGEIPDAPAGTLIQRLREQFATLSREYARRLATIRPEYPEMQRLKSELDAASDALQKETQNFVGTAYADYQAALRKEWSLQNLLEDLKNEAYKANSNSILYNSLRIELANKKILLEALFKRQSEANVSSRLKGLEAVNVWIVDKARYPLRPSFPNKRKIVLIGLLIGLIGGVGLALGLEYLNQTVKTSKDVAISTGFPILGVIPSFDAETKSKGPRSEFTRLVNIIRGGGGAKERENKSALRKADTSILRASPHRPDIADEERRRNTIELIASCKPQSIHSESYRSIRTTLLISYPPGKIKSILFTSPLAREGKSSTVSNLGITLAEANMRVVIVDSDLRKPKQSQIFGSDNGPGLTRFLSSYVDPTDLAKPTQIPNLCLINSGPLPANPLELLTSEKMSELVAFLKRNFEYILFDTPPILAVSDALALAPMADGIILIARGGHTPMQAMKQTKQKLDAHKLKCLGVILNGVNLIEQDGYYARQYYHYSKSD